MTPLQLLDAFGAALADAPDAEQGLMAAASVLQAGLGAESVILWRLAQDTGTMEPAGRAGLVSAPLPTAPTALESRSPQAAIVRVEQRGSLLGALEVRPAAAADPAVVPVIVSMLALSLGALRTAADRARSARELEREHDTARRLADLVVDALPLGLYVIDREYRIRVWNRRRESGMQGMRRERTLGRTVFEVLTRQPADELRAEFDRVFERGEVLRSEASVETPRGTRRYRRTRLPMRMEADAVTHVVTIGEDVTEWRAAEARVLLSEKLAAVGQLAAGVMHEINNPLATISACATAVEGRLADVGVADGQVRDYLTLIGREVERCTSIVDGLLDFSRPRAQAKAAVDLNAIVEETVTLLTPQRRFRHVEVQRELDADAGPVLANREQVIQVLVSLLMNAADAMDGRGHVSVRTEAGEGGVVTVTVEDGGPGITPAVRARLFEPFFTTKPPGRGIGLGLSICYSIMREHGGSIEAESEAGRGARFRLTFPAMERAG
jgi:two-component system NtrC family sensor kinase